MNHDRHIRNGFGKQAEKFEKQGFTLTDQELMAWMIKEAGLRSSDEILDVAAGTGLLARAMSPLSRQVTALDLTPEMLKTGQEAAQREGLQNIQFVLGSTYELPFSEESFDVVTSRLAFHHFDGPAKALTEMVRVCRTSGRVVTIDLLPPKDDQLALKYDLFERKRDPSHVRALPLTTFQNLFSRAGLKMEKHSARDVPVPLNKWFELTSTPELMQEEIIAAINSELTGGMLTGMRPFLKGGVLFFTQTWAVMQGVRH